MTTSADFKLPEHVRSFHDAIAMHANLVVLANGKGGVYFKGYRREHAGDPADQHFIRIHESLRRGDGGPNSGCIIIYNDSKLGPDLAAKVRKHFAEVCRPMKPNGDNASFRDDVQIEEVVRAIRAFGDDV